MTKFKREMRSRLKALNEARKLANLKPLDHIPKTYVGDLKKKTIKDLLEELEWKIKTP